MDKPIGYTDEESGREVRIFVGFADGSDMSQCSAATLIAALQANDELRAKVLRGLPREYWCPTCDAPASRCDEDGCCPTCGSPLGLVPAVPAAELERVSAERDILRKAEPFVRIMAKEEGPLPYLRTIREVIRQLDAHRADPSPAPAEPEAQGEHDESCHFADACSGQCAEHGHQLRPPCKWRHDAESELAELRRKLEEAEQRAGALEANNKRLSVLVADWNHWLSSPDGRKALEANHHAAKTALAWLAEAADSKR